MIVKIQYIEMPVSETMNDRVTKNWTSWAKNLIPSSGPKSLLNKKTIRREMVKAVA